MWKQFKKLIVIDRGEGAILQELLIESESEESCKTVAVLRERKACPNEVLMFNCGYGRMLKF